MSKIKVGLFDDHPLAGKGLSDYMIEEGIDVVFYSSTKEQLLVNIESKKIDVLILDIVAPDVLGLELFEDISSSHPQIKLIAYTSLNSVILLENLLSIGVMGFVNKKQEPKDIIACINTVNNNAICIPEEYHFLTSRYHKLNSNILSVRESEILRLITKELTSGEIAEKLSLSQFTVENHRKNIFKKLEVKNIAGMMVAASRLGYIS